MRILSVLCFVLAIPALVTAQSMVDTITVDPPLPTTEDMITLTLAGVFPHECWEVSEVLPHEFTLWDYSDVGFPCLQVNTPFAVIYEIGPLPAGHHWYQVTEYHLSVFMPDPTTHVIEFDVEQGEVGNEGMSWGLIKAMFK